MKLFTAMQIREAIAFAKAGGQALHVWQPMAGVNHFFWDESAAPECFRKAARSGKPFAHLFDQDVERLRDTARTLGVNVIKVDRPGEDRQHVDLCGRPLDRAIALVGGSTTIVEEHDVFTGRHTMMISHEPPRTESEG